MTEIYTRDCPILPRTAEAFNEYCRGVKDGILMATPLARRKPREKLLNKLGYAKGDAYLAGKIDGVRCVLKFQPIEDEFFYQLFPELEVTDVGTATHQ
jgi:hypothetical protein